MVWHCSVCPPRNFFRWDEEGFTPSVTSFLPPVTPQRMQIPFGGRRLVKTGWRWWEEMPWHKLSPCIYRAYSVFANCEACLIRAQNKVFVCEKPMAPSLSSGKSVEKCWRASYIKMRILFKTQINLFLVAYGSMATWIEHQLCILRVLSSNPGVGSSNPASKFSYLRSEVEWKSCFQLFCLSLPITSHLVHIIQIWRPSVSNNWPPKGTTRSVRKSCESCGS